ncbi:hypothetical protein AURDEDRAFT_159925 [Auricularia subglabra TFB-10046 SS5]|nr:hypothetical protein AURDEDRAFT_159925 [Auricularia subglabra TFB-10046 SS5]
MAANPALPLSLPPELWCSIFSCLPLRSRIAVSHVCHSWRKIALDAPKDLWAQIHWDNSVSTTAVLSARLERAGSALIDLSIVVAREHGYQTVAGLLRRYIPQLRFLGIMINSRTSDECCFSLVDALTSVGAPNLDVFSMCANVCIDQPLFNSDAPLLRHVELDTVLLDAPDMQFDLVTTVSFSAYEIDLYETVPLFQSLFPACEIVRLRAEEFPEPDSPRKMVPWRDYSCGLILHGCSWDALSPGALKYIEHTEISIVEYVVESSDDPANRLPFPHGGEVPLVNSLRMPEYRVSFETHDEDGITVLELAFEDEDGLRRVFIGPYASLRSTVSPAFLSMLTSLDVNEHDLAARFLNDIPPHELGAWGRRGGVMRRIALPYLRKLTLFLLNLGHHEAGDNYDSPFLLCGVPAAHRMDVPHLVELHLTCIDQVRLAPEMVSEFVQLRLGGVQRLDLISLHNVRMLENRVDAVAELLTLATEFEFSSVPLLRMPSLVAEFPDVESEFDFS